MSKSITHNLQNSDNLIWLDMEMTGLSVDDHVIIEVAVVITDSNLNILECSPSYAIYQSQVELDKMDKWNVGTHTKSGLVERVKNSSYTIDVVEKQILSLISKYVPKFCSPLCGNTIHQDRKFIAKFMPHLDAYLHYRIIDVSTIKELVKRWYGNSILAFEKHNKHEALADVIESINELKYYRECVFSKNNTPNLLT